MALCIKTNKPVAFDSPDHIEPWGTARDNSTNLEFNRKLRWWLPMSDIKVLDLACSGGGFVKSILAEGGFAVGVEGSDYSKKNNRAEWATIPSNLFTADITELFSFFEINEDGQERPLKFNVITAWEFIEHVRKDQLPTVFENISRHLSGNGVVIMSVSPNEDIINGVRLHQTVEQKDWWLQTFLELGYKNHDIAVDFFGVDMVRGGDNAPNSFHVVLTRVSEELPFREKLSSLRYNYAITGVGSHITKHLIDSGSFKLYPIHVIDVGAQGGFEPIWHVYGEQINLLGFDPDLNECARLNSFSKLETLRKTFYPIAIDQENGAKVLYKTQNGTASSFLKPNLQYINRFPHSEMRTVIGTCEVKTTYLDSFIGEIGFDYVDFIKIDVEGAELSVLKGSEKLLSESILGLSIKVFFQPCRIGQPTFAEINQYLEQFNFAIFNIEPERWKRKPLVTHDHSTWYGSGQIICAQILYFKDIIPELVAKRHNISKGLHLKALKLASLAEIFGFPDFSLEILENINPI